MSNADAQIKEILSKYGEDFSSNTWVVPGGKARAIYHKTIERMAAKAGISFGRLEIVRDEPENVVIVVWGSLGKGDDYREEWSFGEASPKNNKNAYPYSMAEKRGKDRVALKLLNLHGLLYSEEEAEDFKNSAPREANIVEVQRDEPTESQRMIFTALALGMEKARDTTELELFKTEQVKPQMDALTAKQQDDITALYKDRYRSLNRRAA
jgi:hypothetical protein